MDSTTVACAMAKCLWVVLRMTECCRTSILTQKVDSPWTKMKITVPGWNSGCRVGRNRCLVLLVLLCAGRIQSLLWLHRLQKPDKISWQQTPVLRNCWSKPFYNYKEERIYKLAFQWYCEGLWWAKICIHRRPFSHDPCSPSMLRIYGTRLLRSWDLSPYQNIHNSLAPLKSTQSIWPCCVLDGKPLRNFGGMVMNNQG